MGTGTARTTLVRAFMGAAAVCVGLAACGSASARRPAAARPAASFGTLEPTSSSADPPPSTTLPGNVGPGMCPLTDLPAPGGQVPQRPALAVKVENLPEARPQYGLAAADVIYEEPVEGGITRFIVIYQCHDASRVEPVRSGRLIDPQIVSQYGTHPLIGYAGGVDAAVSAIDSSSLVDVGVNRAVSDYWRDSSRVAPHNLETSTSDLYSYGAQQQAANGPPSPVFTFGPMGLGWTPAASLQIRYIYSDLTWTWSPTAGVFYRSYSDTGPADLGDGGQISATNVIVMHVNMYPSPYVEDVTGTHENLLTLTGTRQAEVFRNGAEITGTWNRPSLSDTTTYLDGAGNAIPLAPGQTWVELVPATVVTSVSS